MYTSNCHAGSCLLLRHLSSEPASWLVSSKNEQSCPALISPNPARFFDLREAHAESLGLHVKTFCAVQRPPDHPLRPQPERTLSAFWRARGYVERPDLHTEMRWQDVGQTEESAKTIRFWVKKD